MAVAPRDASEDPDDHMGLPPSVEELRPRFPPMMSVEIVSGAGVRFTGVLPVDGGACLVFDPTCSDAVISDSMATGVPRHSSSAFSGRLNGYMLRFIAQECDVCRATVSQIIPDRPKVVPALRHRQ